MLFLVNRHWTIAKWSSKNLNIVIIIIAIVIIIFIVIIISLLNATFLKQQIKQLKKVRKISNTTSKNTKRIRSLPPRQQSKCVLISSKSFSNPDCLRIFSWGETKSNMLARLSYISFRVTLTICLTWRMPNLNKWSVKSHSSLGISSGWESDEVEGSDESICS